MNEHIVSNYCPNFVCRIAEKGRGKGLFAKRGFQHGETVFRHRPLFAMQTVDSKRDTLCCAACFAYIFVTPSEFPPIIPFKERQQHTDDPDSHALLCLLQHLQILCGETSREELILTLRSRAASMEPSSAAKKTFTGQLNPIRIPCMAKRRNFLASAHTTKHGPRGGNGVVVSGHCKGPFSVLDSDYAVTLTHTHAHAHTHTHILCHCNDTCNINTLHILIRTCYVCHNLTPSK